MNPRALPEPSEIFLYQVVMLVIVLFASVFRENALAEQVLSAGYNEGFYVKSREDGINGRAQGPQAEFLSYRHQPSSSGQ